ncbi:MAG: putative transcriptional regulator [Anaerocolumna sp.]|jgi:DNA-binding PadR family transcriptional regulator|nr:putative transcriptional regulator [Anaerocolumna sp.]
MNKLSYGLLGLISTQPLTGYDLTAKINRFWRSTHSAIYPLLSDLTVKGYIECVSEKQSGKPDKKIYTLSDSGRELLNEWFSSETGSEVIRDEASLKMYCIKCMDEETANKLFDELEIRYKNKIDEYKKALLKLKDTSLEQENAAFGGYILTQRALAKAEIDLCWCQWVRKVYKETDMNFMESSFTDYR